MLRQQLCNEDWKEFKNKKEDSMKKGLLLLVCFFLLAAAAGADAVTKMNIPKELSKASQECVGCHKKQV